MRHEPLDPLQEVLDSLPPTPVAVVSAQLLRGRRQSIFTEGRPRFTQKIYRAFNELGEFLRGWVARLWASWPSNAITIDLYDGTKSPEEIWEQWPDQSIIILGLQLEQARRDLEDSNHDRVFHELANMRDHLNTLLDMEEHWRTYTPET